MFPELNNNFTNQNKFLRDQQLCIFTLLGSERDETRLMKANNLLRPNLFYTLAIEPTLNCEIYPELDQVKFRQLPCRTFISTGTCPYRDRCDFIHDPRVASAQNKVRCKV